MAIVRCAERGTGRPRRLAQWCLAMCLAAVTAGASPSVHAERGYSLDEDSWSGVGYLLHTAREAKVELDVLAGKVELESLRPGDVLFWLYPQTKLPVDQLVRFVKDGGFLVVADDQGNTDALFKAFGITRLSGGPTAHQRYYRGLSGLPELAPRPAENHFLYFNVTRIVANHPAALTGGSPVYSFDTPPGRPQEHLVVEKAAGRGRFIAIGDPSLFINDMIGRPELHGNKQFAANAMRRNCTRECKVKLLLPSSTVEGTYRERGGPLGELPRLFDDAAQLLNESLADVSAALSDAPWSWLVVFVLGVLAVMAVARALGHLGTTPRQTDGGGVSGGAVVSPLVHDALGMAYSRNDADFGHLARTLLTHVEGLESAGLAPSPKPRPDVAEDDTARLARRAMLRIRGEAASFQGPGEPPLISSERFLRLYDDVRLIARFATAQRHVQRRGARATRTAKESHART